MSKKFILFAGDGYYPVGGSGDFIAFGDTVEELQLLYKDNEDNWSEPWGEIVEAETMKRLWVT